MMRKRQARSKKMSSVRVSPLQKGNITLSGGNITLTGGTITLSSSSTSLVLGDTGIVISASDGQTMSNVMNINTSGLFTLDATDDNSYIRFGGTTESPNFVLGLGGDIIANVGKFSEIISEEGDIVLSPNGYLAPKVVVGSTKPSGSNILWFQPSSVSTLDYTWRGSGHKVGSGNPITFARSSSMAALGGNEIKVGIKLSIYVYGGSAISSTVAVDIKGPNDSAWTNIAQKNFSYVGDGSSLSINTLSSPVTLTYSGGTNITDNNEIQVRAYFTKGSVTARFTNNSSFTLRCSNSSSAAQQACNVWYLQ